MSKTITILFLASSSVPKSTASNLALEKTTTAPAAAPTYETFTIFDTRTIA